METNKDEDQVKVKEEYKEKKTASDKYLQIVLRLSIKVLMVLLLLMLIFSVAELSFLVVKGMLRYHAAFAISPEPVNREMLFITQVQGLVAAALLLTILIEFIQSLNSYLKSADNNYVAIITEIALIAIVRHILTINPEHIQPGVLFGLSALIFVLGLFFVTVNRKIIPFKERNS